MISHLAGAQDDKANSRWFDNMVGLENTELISGREYLPRFMGRISNPFLDQRKPFPGSLSHRSQPYYDLFLLYDIYQDILVLSHNLNNQQPILMEFDRDDIEWFRLQGRHFEHVMVLDSATSGIGSGYFEVLSASSRSRLLVKRRKTDYLENGIREFRDNHLYFIELYRYPGTLIAVDSRSDFMLIYPEKSAEIKQFVKQNKLKPRAGREPDLIQLFGFCDPEVNSETQ